MRQALELALEALETPRPFDSYPPLWRAYEKTINEAITAIKEALAQPEEEKLHPVHIGVDVTREGTAVTAFYRKPDAVMEMFYSQFHPLAQPEQWGASAVTHPEYIAEQKAKTQELRSMLAQPEQEPVAKYSDIVSDGGLDPRTTIPPQGIYYTPPQRKPLTDEQLKPLIQKAMMYYGHNPEHWTVTAGAGFCILARAIEAAHGIKE